MQDTVALSMAVRTKGVAVRALAGAFDYRDREFRMNAYIANLS